MTYTYFSSFLLGILQLAVPTYGLRLHRLFGSRHVGWALVVSFWGLALLNLAGSMGSGSAGVPREWDLARSFVGAVIPVLLLIGLAHIETLFTEHAQVERQQKLWRCELQQVLDRRTEELSEVREEYQRQVNRKAQDQRAFEEKAQQERLQLGAEIAAKAGQHLNRHAAVIELYAKLLLAKQSRAGTTQDHERLVAEAAEAQALGRRLLACGCCQPLRTQLLSLSDVVRRHKPTLQKLLGEDRSLECNCPTDAPLVWADPHFVKWMLEELVRNARDAMPDTGRVSITVERTSANHSRLGQNPCASQFASVVITDTGRGMGREVQEHLGEPFFTTRHGSRAGLGLASVSGLIKAHGGQLEVASALGHGTGVRLFFPAAAARLSGTPAPDGLAANHGVRL